MRFTSEQRLDDGVVEREFTLGEIPRHSVDARIPRAAMSPAASGGRSVEPVTEEDF